MPETRCDSAQNRDRCKLCMLCSIGVEPLQELVASCGTISVASLAPAWRGAPNLAGKGLSDALSASHCQTMKMNSPSLRVPAAFGRAGRPSGRQRLRAQAFRLRIRGPRPIVKLTKELGPLSLCHTMTAPTRLKIIRGRSPDSNIPNLESRTRAARPHWHCGGRCPGRRDHQ